LFEQHDVAAYEPPEMRQGKAAVRVLEQIGTPAARRVLAEAARGAAEFWLTEEARAALARTR
jgi:hypothetical protein